MRHVLLAIVLSFGLATPVWADYQAGLDAYKRGDYATALREWKPLAEAGDAKAQRALAIMYKDGKGVPQDTAKSVEWYRKAAEHHALGQTALGAMFRDGQGVPQDYSEAVKWFRKAAEQGQAMAQSDLAAMYANGQGVLQDDVEAVKWFRKAAEQGNALGQRHLGFMYANGRGGPRDDAEAARWYRKAAEQGLAQAQLNLGGMYRLGQGVPQDYAEALRWLRKAAAQGNKPAGQFVAEIERNHPEMSEAEKRLGLPNHAQDFQKGQEAARRGDYATALRKWRPLAEQGNGAAQQALGSAYLYGWGVPKDYAAAVKWYRKAAEQGNAQAQANLGFRYEYGEGVPQDYARAVKWFRKAAEQGHAGAQKALGRLAQSDKGAEKLVWSVADAQWKLGYAHDEKKAKWAIRKFVRPGETVQNWTELLTILNFTSYPPPDIAMKGLKAQREKRCPNVFWNIIQREEKKVLYEWRITDCPANPDQHEVALLIYGKWNVFNIAYVAKVKELTPEVRDKWIKAFSKAKIVPKG